MLAATRTPQLAPIDIWAIECAFAVKVSSFVIPFARTGGPPVRLASQREGRGGQGPQAWQLQQSPPLHGGITESRTLTSHCHCSGATVRVWPKHLQSASCGAACLKGQSHHGNKVRLAKATAGDGGHRGPCARHGGHCGPGATQEEAPAHLLPSGGHSIWPYPQSSRRISHFCQCRPWLPPTPLRVCRHSSIPFTKVKTFPTSRTGPRLRTGLSSRTSGPSGMASPRPSSRSTTLLLPRRRKSSVLKA